MPLASGLEHLYHRLESPKMDGIPLSAVLKNVLMDGKFSDFTITCRGNTFHDHRNILCTQSRYFDVAANGAFAVRQSYFCDIRSG